MATKNERAKRWQSEQPETVLNPMRMYTKLKNGVLECPETSLHPETAIENSENGFPAKSKHPTV